MDIHITCDDECSDWNCNRTHSEDRIQKCVDAVQGVKCTKASCKRFFLHPEQPMVK